MDKHSVILTRNELYVLVWSNSMVALSKQYAISDNGLRNICKRMNIPLPGNGHWMKLQFGKKVRVIQLPEDSIADQTVELDLRNDSEEGIDDPLKMLAKEINIIVTQQLQSPDELVIAARRILTAKGKSIHNGTLRTYSEAIDLHVSPTCVHRALLIMDIFIKVLRRRGHSIFFKNGETYVKVKGQDQQVKLREQTKRVKGENSWAEYVPTGILYFKIDRYPDKEFKDGSRKLEDKMPDIITWMELQADLDNARAEERRIQREIEKVEEEKVRRIEADREKEMEKYSELMAAAKRWEQVRMIREYVEAVLAAGGADPGWVEWARKKADWLDPLVKAEDGVLGRYS